MQETVSNPSCHLTPGEILWGLMTREQAAWALTPTGSSMYPTNPDALHYVIDLNQFRMCDVDNVVVFGLRDLGTAEQRRANYDNQGLADDQQRAQNVAITQLQMVRMVRDYIQSHLRNQAAVSLYICDLGFTESVKQVLQEAQFTVIGRNELSRHINQNTLVYDTNMHAGELQRIVDLSWGQTTAPPAAVITHLSSLSPNGAFDGNLLWNYWLSPLLDTTPSLIVSEEMFQSMRKSPGTQPFHDKWVSLQEQHSHSVRQGYFEETAAHSRAMARYQEYVARVARRDGGIPDAPPPLPKESWVSDPMMIILCRKDHPRPPLIVPGPQQRLPQPQQQQPEYRQGGENWVMGGFGGTGESERAEEFERAQASEETVDSGESEDFGESEEFEESHEFEEAFGYGRSSNLSYASMPGPYSQGGFDSHGGGSSQFLSVPHDDSIRRARRPQWPRNG